jgi:dihydroxyacetone kinase-like protein
MVDTLFPVVEGMKKAVNLKLELVETLKLASDAAEKGMNSTKDMIAKRGRASYLGERSRGHIDPGAASSYLIIKTIYQYVSGQA